MQITDYGNSYIVWTSKLNPADKRKPGHMPYQNTVRILLDARCWIIDEESGRTTEYNLISPCRTEWMYRDEPLWQQPNYEFSGIFGQEVAMYGHIRGGDLNAFGGDWRRVTPLQESNLQHQFSIRHYPEARRLEDDAATIEATMSYVPIVARTELQSADGRLRAISEYPIRTMNMALEQGRVQVDTGPLIFPDLETPAASEIERLHWSFVCYNTESVAEFVLRGPTPIASAGQNIASYIDYSEVRRVAMKNSFYAALL